MCWKCDIKDAKDLLADAKRILAEATTLRKHGCHVQAQAYGDMHRAALAREAGEPLCKEE